MIDPTREVLVAFNKLNTEGGDAWPTIRKWLKDSLKPSLEIPDSGVSRGMAYQLVQIIDTIDNARQLLRDIDQAGNNKFVDRSPQIL